MKILIALIAIVLMTVSSSHAQNLGGRRHARTTKTETPKPKVDEKAYSAALKSLPDKQFDPWHGAR